MSDVLDCLIAVAGRLEALRKLKERADPASGISIKIRIGPLSEQDRDERCEWREYLGLESCRYHDEIISLLLKEQEESLKFWIASAKDLALKLTNAVNKIQPPAKDSP